jgi:hypothetical protein
MRAKSVNEKMNFTDENDPIADMEIGGINFNEQFDEMFKKSMKSLEGKTITAKMIKYWMERGGKPMESKLSSQTIKVSKVDPPYLKSFGGFNYQWMIYLNDDKGHRYSLDLDQKIHIQ